MPAPLKRNDQYTGDYKTPLLATLLLLALVALVLFTPGIDQSVKQPSAPLPSSSTDQAQVQGAATDSTPLPDTENQPQNTVSDTNVYLVTAVIDGDTIKVRIGDKTETVRLIGVDTPETKDPRKPVQCYGQQASDFTKKSLLNSNVTLMSDDSQQNRDKYGRLLRYVYITGGQNFNLLLIASGYAYEYTYKLPYQFQTDFKNAQEEAKRNKLGLWNDSTCAGVR